MGTRIFFITTLVTVIKATEIGHFARLYDKKINNKVSSPKIATLTGSQTLYSWTLTHTILRLKMVPS